MTRTVQMTSRYITNSTHEPLFSFLFSEDQCVCITVTITSNNTHLSGAVLSVSARNNTLHMTSLLTLCSRIKFKNTQDVSYRSPSLLCCLVRLFVVYSTQARISFSQIFFECNYPKKPSERIRFIFHPKQGAMMIFNLRTFI